MGGQEKRLREKETNRKGKRHKTEKTKSRIDTKEGNREKGTPSQILRDQRGEWARGGALEAAAGQNRI